MRRVILYFILVIGFFLYNFYYRPVEGNPLIDEEYQNSSSYVNSLYKSDEYFKKKLISEEEEPYYEKVVEAIKNGEDSSNLDCDLASCSGFMNDVYYSLYLDHPELLIFQGMGWRAYENKVEIKYYHLNKLQNDFGTRRIERELDIVKKETKDMDEKEKIIFVYEYVAGHQYDRIFMYSSGNQSAYSFFTKSSSVCAGFAKASQILFQNIGIESLPVISDDHMWNYVKYDGKYYVFDATVGASYVKKDNIHFYDGLGKTTMEEVTGLYPEYYPPIEETTLKELFKLS